MASALYFTGVRQVSVREEEIPGPGPAQLLVETQFSAVSHGTEMLLYRGQVPQDLSMDATLPQYQQQPHYPLRYGYASVGRVVGLGRGAPEHLQGRRVFSFSPHATHCVADPSTVVPLPDDVESQDAVMLASMETAVSLVLDAHPSIGERVAVIGQGMVGTLTTALLDRYPLEHLTIVDRLSQRCRIAQELGAHTILSDATELANGDYDLVIELSGEPQNLNHAIDACRFDGRVLVGSWYGTKRAPIDLGANFHRRRIKLISSQVSTIAPELSGRFDKTRRMSVAISMLQQIKPSRLVHQTFPLHEAAQVYQTIDRNPDQLSQAIFSYH